MITKIRSSVIKMFRVNPGLRAGEKVVAISDFPTKNMWPLPVDELQSHVNRTSLARTVEEIGKNSFKTSHFESAVYPAT